MRPLSILQYRSGDIPNIVSNVRYSVHGAGVGWSLPKPPEAITLLDVYQAVERKPLFELHHSEPNQSCPIGHGIRSAVCE